MSTSGTSFCSGGNTTPTTSTVTAPPQRAREVDEASIASDFSVIPESLMEAEGGLLGEGRTFSTTSFLRSEDLQPSASAMESHNKVVFQGIQPTYYIDSDVAASYTLGSSVAPKSSDRVGLYRVGFSSYQDYLDYQWAPAPTPDHTAHHLPLTIVFKASSFPKEVGEFFQFCYVTHEGQIIGVSTPFQLQRVGAAKEMCVVEEEDGMVVVRSSESVLHGRVNELTMQKEKLLVEVNEARTMKEEMGKQLEERAQQLSQCQHHLQVLEVKLKRETSEKCELMGRIGQVVEEKGHLEDKLRTLERALTSERAKVTSLQDRATVSEARVRELEDEALASRKTLETTAFALRSLEGDLGDTKEALKNTMQQLEEVKEEREKAVRDLEIWTSTAEADQSEKNSLATKFSAVNEELIVKLEELEGSRKNCFALEEKLNRALKELEEAKGKLEGLERQVEGLEEVKRVHLEREEVVKQDTTHLQATITALKDHITHLEEEQGNERKGREAAETIACDLSGRLQAARSEYHNLALTNRKLAKKVKKLRQKCVTEAGVEGSSSGSSNTAMITSTTSTGSWLHAEAEEEDGGEENAGGGDGDACEGIPSSLTQSCMTVAPSCCSHSTQQLSEAVHRKMEDIVRELSQQIFSLKLQLQEKEETRTPQPQQEEQEEEEKSVGNEGKRSEDRGERRSSEECEDREEEAASTAQNHMSRTESLLYGNSFLPTAPTAPVFLPEGDNTTAPQPPITTTPTDPTPAPRAHYYLPRIPPTPQHTPPTASNGASLLPPPLQPETTPTARQAAVLSQFTLQQQQQQTTALSAPGHESDDDDFHSTSDSDTPAASPPPFPPPPLPAATAIPSQQQQRQFCPSISPGTSPTSTLLDCPLCSLSFPMGTIRLLEEHINSHLEHVCPVCSEVFQRNCQEKFQDHVHSHFEEEEAAEEERQRRAAADPSGPWEVEMRNGHLLEID